MSGRDVLLVGSFLSATTGHRQYCEDLADRLAGRGLSVTRTSTHMGRGRRLADMLATAWRRRRDYDVAHLDVYSGLAFFWAEAVAFELARLGKPYVLTLHGGNLPEFAKRWPRRVRRLLRSATIVTAPSQYLREELQPYRADIRLVRNAIDAKAYAFQLRERARPRLVWVRALHEVYNPRLAVEVLARIVRRHPDATLRMVGPDKDGTLADVERAIEQLGVRKHVTIVGKVLKTDVPRQLAEGDVFLNTTNIDNTPISVLEALATGLCVVSTSVGGLPFLLRDEHDALLVPPRDPDAMTSAVERVLGTPDLARGLSSAGHELALACDWGTVLDQWESVLQEGARA